MSKSNGPRTEADLKQEARREVGQIVSRLLEKKIAYQKQGRADLVKTASELIGYFVEVYVSVLEGRVE
jgi:hypothetical protein